MDRIEEAKSRLALILSLYPIVIGLYAVGFFWDLPGDIIGAFELTDFIFKASIVYLTGVAAIGVPALLFTIAYSPLAKGSSKTADAGGSEGHETWRSMTPRRKILFSVASIAILSVFGVLFFKHPPTVKFDPPGFFAILLLFYIIGIIIRPFTSANNWDLGKILIGFTLILILPILAGYSDAMPSEGSPHVAVSGERCAIVFAGTESVIARCGGRAVVAKRSDELILEWAE